VLLWVLTQFNKTFSWLDSPSW